MGANSKEALNFAEMKYIDCTDPETKQAYSKYLQELEDLHDPDQEVIITFKGLEPVIKTIVHYWPPTKYCDLKEGYQAVQCLHRHRSEVAKELQSQGNKVLDFYYQ